MIMYDYDYAFDHVTVAIRYPHGRISWNLPQMLDELSQAKLKKAFRLIMENRYENPENREVPDFLTSYIDGWVKQKNELWGMCRETREREYIDPKTIKGRTKEDIHKRKLIKEANDKCTRSVCNAQKAYTRSEKIKAMWTDIRSQYV